MAAGARHEGIDVARWFAFVGVVLVHCSGLGETASWVGGFGRLAVPFFFLASGYFLSGRLTDPDAVLRMLVRLSGLWLFWVLIYVLRFDRWPETDRALWLLLIHGGPAFHLWFLTSLMVCVAALHLLRRCGWGVVFAVAGAAYVVGLAIAPYAAIGVRQSLWDPRNGVTFGLIFLAAGAFIRERGVRPALRPAAIAAGVLALLHLGERRILYALTQPRFMDFTVMTLPAGVACFLAAQAWDGGRLARWGFAYLGRLSFGMFAVHVLWRNWIFDRFEPQGLWPWAATVAAVVALSTLSALALDRIPPLRRFVR